MSALTAPLVRWFPQARGKPGQTQAAKLLLLAAVALLPYLFVLSHPFVSDDYLQIALARKYGPVSGWTTLANDVLYRARATSLVLTYWTERLYGLAPQAFYASGIFLHILNTWLVFALGLRLGMGRRMALCAAAFFAIYEGHQEAVMWYAALPELLVFFFSLSALFFWSVWLANRANRELSYSAALICFCLALLSKESAVIVVPLLLLTAWNHRRAWPWVSPFAILTFGFAWATFAGQQNHQHFHDGTFSLAAPVWITLPNSYGRLLWIWGLLALVALLAWRHKRYWRVAQFGAIWIAIGLLPYSFLTYMPRVPSRHTYLASAGLAWLVSAGFLAFRRHFQASTRWAASALAAVVLLHNCGYVWIKKRVQFLERATPTETLVGIAREADGPIYVRCFPYNHEIAKSALEVRLNKPAASLIWRKTHSDFSRACLEEEVHLPLRTARPMPGSGGEF